MLYGRMDHDGETGKPSIRKAWIQSLLQRLFMGKGRGLKVTAFWDDKIYMEGPDRTEIKYRKYRTVQPEFLGAAFFNPPKKVTRIVFSDPDPAVRLEIRKAIENKFGDAVDVVFPGDDFVDMHKSGINKATAVKYLADQARFPLPRSWHLEIRKMMSRFSGWQESLMQ